MDVGTGPRRPNELIIKLKVIKGSSENKVAHQKPKDAQLYQ